MNMSLIGLIGGSGIYNVPELEITENRSLSTPFGKPSAPYRIGKLSGKSVTFLSRHGPDHKLPPHRINYRANIWGFKELGVERIISVNACGGISEGLSPGDIVIIDQIIDMTQGARNSTFYESEDVVHVDFTEPYCPELREAIISGGDKADISLTTSGTYICVNGPRLESRAEIRLFSNFGADVVGMTGMPEAALSRELEMCFSAIAVVTNFAAGIAGKKLTTVEVVQTMNKSTGKIKNILLETLSLIPTTRSCPCKDALKDSIMG